MTLHFLPAAACPYPLSTLRTWQAIVTDERAPLGKRIGLADQLAHHSIHADTRAMWAEEAARLRGEACARISSQLKGGVA